MSAPAGTLLIHIRLTDGVEYRALVENDLLHFNPHSFDADIVYTKNDAGWFKRGEKRTRMNFMSSLCASVEVLAVNGVPTREGEVRK